MPKRILVIADIQTHRALSKTEQLQLSCLIDKAEPDYVVLLGDMLQGLLVPSERRARAIIDSIMSPIVARHLPFALVFGNHDSDSRVSLEKQLEIYQSYPGCLTPSFSDRPCPEAYTLKLSPSLALLFIDSGKTKVSFRGIEYLPPRPETLDYSETFLNDPATPKTLIFQHVAVPDICRLLKPTQSKKGIKGKGPFKGQTLALKNPSTGTLGEMPCSSWENKTQFASWRDSGKVLGAVFAHDHKNSFVDTLDDITIIQTPCAGFVCYGDDALRGVRLLTISDTNKIEATEFRYGDL